MIWVPLGTLIKLLSAASAHGMRLAIRTNADIV
jgi:hypothetical protein